MSRDLDELIEDIAGDVAALTIHAYNDYGVKVARPNGQTVPPTSLADRLALLVYAVHLMRCDGCARLATIGRLCQTCHDSTIGAELHP